MATNPHQASVSGMDLPLSLKQCVEVSRFIRGKSIKRAIEMLQSVIDKKMPVPYKRYVRDIPHRTSIGPGRYPEKVCRHFIVLVNSLAANAQNKGLNVDALVIKRAIPNIASRPYHAGRIRGRKAKRAHIQLIAEEKEAKKQKNVAAKEVAKK